MAAPKKNRNALRHGLRSTRLPKEAKYIEQSTAILRNALEKASLEQFGDVSQVVAACIHTACRAERRALLAERWFRLEGDTLPLKDRLALQSDIVAASLQRDRAIFAIGLSANPQADATWIELREEATNRVDEEPAPENTTENPRDDTLDAADLECTHNSESATLSASHSTTEGESSDHSGLPESQHDRTDGSEPEAGD